VRGECTARHRASGDNFQPHMVEAGWSATVAWLREGAELTWRILRYRAGLGTGAIYLWTMGFRVVQLRERSRIAVYNLVIALAVYTCKPVLSKVLIYLDCIYRYPDTT
jgi:hypothetical protein